MPVAESTTLPGVETPPSATFTRTFCEHSAPRHDGKNPLIVINVDVAHGKAIIHCQTERVSNDPDSHVRFLADADCKLAFDNKDVFGTTELALTQGQEKDLKIPPKAKGGTDVFVNSPGMETMALGVKNPPRIVVP